MNLVDDDLVSAYLDGELTKEERAVVAELVHADSRWASRLENFQSDSEAIQKLPAQELSERLRTRAYQLAETNLEAGVDRRRVPRYRRRWILVAAVLIPTIFTLIFFQNPAATSRLYLRTEGLTVEAGRSVPPAEFQGRQQWQSPRLWGEYQPDGRNELRLELDSEEPTKQRARVILEYDFDGDGQVDRTEVYSSNELNLGRNWQSFHPTIEQSDGEYQDFQGGVVKFILEPETTGVFKLSGTPAEIVLPYLDLRTERS
jgi:hypothetical protein